MSERIRGVNWCFTWNYPEDLSREQVIEGMLPIKEASNYLAFGFETAPTTGRKHLQGYFHLKKKLDFSVLAAMVPNISLRLQKGTDAHNERYIRKEGDVVVFGELKSKQGKRNDLKVALEAIKGGMSYEDFRNEYPDICAKYPNWVSTEYDRITRQLIQSEWRVQYDDLYEWQKTVVDRIKAQQEREVHWIYDLRGGSGKSFLTKYLVHKLGWQPFLGGKGADIAYELDPRAAGYIFDFARAAQEYVPYKILEEIKNGIISAPKYESRTKYIRREVDRDAGPRDEEDGGGSLEHRQSFATYGRLVIFANFLPDRDKLSADRWRIYEVVPNPIFKWSLIPH